MSTNFSLHSSIVRLAAPHHCLLKPHLLAPTFPCLCSVFHPSLLLSRLVIFLQQDQRIPILPLSAQTCGSSTPLLNWKWFLFFHAIIRLTVWIEHLHLFPIIITWLSCFFNNSLVLLLFLLKPGCLFINVSSRISSGFSFPWSLFDSWGDKRSSLTRDFFFYLKCTFAQRMQKSE